MVNQKSSWHEAVVYQVYPWTFYEDSKRHPQKGNGTIRGIIDKLPYLKQDLGVDAIWVTPFYKSPLLDGGYDITDHKGVHEELGTLKDVEDLIKSAHDINVKVMFDIAVNHTSNQHEWFEKSRKKKDGYDDWYIWHSGRTDEQGNRLPPNNWGSVRSKLNKKARARGEMPNLKPEDNTPYVSAWQWDDERGEFYLRSFAKEQPDLNWSNPDVREAMKDIMRFWLNKGVDGFRVDAVNYIGKNMQFPDEGMNTAYTEEEFDNPYDQLLRENSCNFPDTLHAYVREICQVLREEQYASGDQYLILEAYMGESELRELNDIDPEVASTFNFGAMRLGWGATIRKIQMDSYYTKLPQMSIGNQVNGNHDNPRIATALGDVQSRSAFFLNIFLPGMNFIYNGEELGLHNAFVPPDRIRDPEGLRDDFRTPIIWDDALPNAGFSNAEVDKLWLPVNENDYSISLTKQFNDPKSTFQLYKHAIRLNRELPALKDGEYIPLKTNNEYILAFGRSYGDDEVVVIVNFSPYVQHTDLIGNDFASARTVLSSINVIDDPRDLNLEAGIHIKANEAIVIIPNREPFALWK